jgi:hypothetical protein
MCRVISPSTRVKSQSGTFKSRAAMMVRSRAQDVLRAFRIASRSPSSSIGLRSRQINPHLSNGRAIDLRLLALGWRTKFMNAVKMFERLGVKHQGLHEVWQVVFLAFTECDEIPKSIFSDPKLLKVHRIVLNHRQCKSRRQKFAIQAIKVVRMNNNLVLNNHHP